MAAETPVVIVVYLSVFDHQIILLVFKKGQD